MDRGATAAFLTEIAKDENSLCHLFEAEFDAGTTRLTDAGFDITWSSNLYTSTQLLSFTGLSETRQPLVNRVTFVLSGVDQALISIILADDFLDRACRIYKAVFDSSGLVADPLKIFEGRMDEPNIALDPSSGTATVSVGAAAIWADFELRRGRHTNNDDNQTFFPTDEGFEFVTEIPNKIFWGTKDPTVKKVSIGGGGGYDYTKARF